MSHTPGPWEVDTTVALGAYGVWTAYSTHQIEGAGAGFASQICSVPLTGTQIPREQRDANACLIAAAPDLLGVVDAIIGELDHANDHGGLTERSRKLFEDALAAAKKARGR